MIKSKYDPESGIITVWNCFNSYKNCLYSISELDSNLCFTHGWVNFPALGYAEFSVWDSIKPYINKLGVRVKIYEGEELIHFQDHYVVDEKPSNHFYSNDFDMQYGSWYSLYHLDEYEGFLKFTDEDVVYDLGSNIGVFTKWVLNQGNVKHIYAFEPTPELVKLAAKTFSPNPNVTIFDKAISGTNTIAKFQTFSNSVSNTLRDFEGKNETYIDAIDVECVNLEEFISTNDLLFPTIIKCDIEGAEYDFLDNTSDEFLSKVKIIILEYHENYKNEIWDVIKKFLSLGFKFKIKSGDDLEYHMGTIIFYK